MLKGKRKSLMFHKEFEGVQNIITAVKTLIKLEADMYLEDPTVVHKRRAYSSETNASLTTSRPRASASISQPYNKNFLLLPEGITLESIHDVLNPLEIELAVYAQRDSTTHNDGFDLELASLQTVGTKVQVQWNKEEIGDTGWKIGMEHPIRMCAQYVTCGMQATKHKFG